MRIADERAEDTYHVGNDIVDLHDPEAHPETLHARFDDRVFTVEERAVLGASPSTHRLRWTLWAAKESAYKVAKKMDATVGFLPRAFRVTHRATQSATQLGTQRVTQKVSGRSWEGRALVLHEMGSFDVRLESTDEWVHAIATPASVPASVGAPSTWRPVHAGIEHLGAGLDPSRRVRELAGEAVGSRLDLPLGQVRIERDGRIPVAFVGARRLPVDLSLSHHGRFVAWAWGEQPAPPIRAGRRHEIRATTRSV